MSKFCTIDFGLERLPAAGYKLQATGYKPQDTGYWLQAASRGILAFAEACPPGRIRALR